jgi:hypothetical protein
MEFDQIRTFILPLVLIGVGLFIKNTTIENLQSSKKQWKWLVIIGSISFFLKVILLFLKAS